jgi:hypothetical protein
MTDLERALLISEREPHPKTWAEELERAREIVREVGDLPEPIAYEMLMRSDGTSPDPLAELMAVRPPNAPDYPPTGRI